MVLALTAISVLISALLGLTAPWLGDRLPPGTAVKVLAPTAFATALATGFCLSMVAFTALARIPLIATVGHWSANTLGVDGTPPPVGGAVLGFLVVGLLVMALRRSLATAAELAQAILACRQLRELSNGLVLLEDDAADAFAIPGLRGRIVVTTGMLQALGPREREVLLAHERAHLSDHHQLYIQAANLAAAANPLLRPAAAQIRKLTERWADEAAAQAVGDRHLTARALARAALAYAGNKSPTKPPLGLATATGDVAQRALALTRPAPGPRPRLALAVVALGLISVLTSLGAAHATEGTFEYAHAAYFAQTASVHPNADPR